MTNLRKDDGNTNNEEKKGVTNLKAGKMASTNGQVLYRVVYELNQIILASFLGNGDLLWKGHSNYPKRNKVLPSQETR